MTHAYHTCGSLRRTPVGEIASKCAAWIMEAGSPVAVAVDPEGRVTVEPVSEACESDLVGVYDRAPGLLALTRAIREDLLCVRVDAEPRRRRVRAA